MEQVIWLFVGLIIGFLVAALLVYWFLGWREKNLIQRYELRLRQMTEQYEARLRQMEEKHRQEVEQARRQSVEQSRHTIKGQISEQLVPLLPGFKFFPADARFIGHRLITWSFTDTPICAMETAAPISSRWCFWTSSAIRPR
jgi:predicted Holliday junction resolvase-like endonuclease